MTKTRAISIKTCRFVLSIMKKKPLSAKEGVWRNGNIKVFGKKGTDSVKRL